MNEMALKYIKFEMAEFINAQVYGVPVLTYGLIGVTTAVLAYATSIGMGDNISKSLGSLSEMAESPMGALSSMNPLAPASAPTGESEPKTEDSAMAGLNPFASSEGTGTGEAKENTEQPPPPPEEVKGGKKHNRKSPKSKKSKRRTKSKKAKK